MATCFFHRGLEAWARGQIDFDTDPFKAMLTTNAYSENKATHAFRSDVTNEVTGTGYTAGGNTVTVTVNLDTANNRLDITLGGSTWPSSTITARKAVYYKARGGAASADEVIAVNDGFGAGGVSQDVTTAAGTFTLNASTLRINNP
jgi:hypothetical protein